MTKLCSADITIRDDEHRMYVCDREEGHEGDHWHREVTVYWTDEDTTVEPETTALSPDELIMSTCAMYVDEWRRGEDAWHGVSHLRQDVFKPQNPWLTEEVYKALREVESKARTYKDMVWDQVGGEIAPDFAEVLGDDLKKALADMATLRAKIISGQ